jgi:hypothetical protein
MAFEHAADGEGPSKNAAMVFLASTLRIRLTDFGLNPVAGGRCRVSGQSDTVYDLDGDGIVDIPIQDRAQRWIDLEWGPPGAVEKPFPWRNTFDLGIRTAEDGDCATRLTHLGFLGESLSHQVNAYQGFLGLEVTGNLIPHRSAIVLLHDDGKTLARGGSKAKGGAAPAESDSSSKARRIADARALVKKLYEAFGDSGFLGLGGTDEEGVLAALKSARDQGLMRDVEALYRQTYPDEPSLKDEIDDELSGDEFATAMKYYDEGMKAPSTPAPAARGKSSGGGTATTPAPLLPVRGTLAPAPARCILEFGVAASEKDGAKKAVLYRRRMKDKKYTGEYDRAETVLGQDGSFAKLDFPKGPDFNFWFWGQISPKHDAKVFWKTELGAGYRILLTINRKAKPGEFGTPRDPIDVTNMTRLVEGFSQGVYEYETDRQYRPFWEADLRVLDEIGAEKECQTIRLREKYADPAVVAFDLLHGSKRVTSQGGNEILSTSSVTVEWKLEGDHLRNGLELRIYKGSAAAGKPVMTKTIQPRVPDGSKPPKENSAQTGSKKIDFSALKEEGVYTAVFVLTNKDGDVSNKSLTFTLGTPKTIEDKNLDVPMGGDYEDYKDNPEYVDNFTRVWYDVFSHTVHLFYPDEGEVTLQLPLKGRQSIGHTDDHVVGELLVVQDPDGGEPTLQLPSTGGQSVGQTDDLIIGQTDDLAVGEVVVFQKRRSLLDNPEAKDLKIHPTVYDKSTVPALIHWLEQNTEAIGTIHLSVQAGHGALMSRSLPEELHWMAYTGPPALLGARFYASRIRPSFGKYDPKKGEIPILVSPASSPATARPATKRPFLTAEKIREMRARGVRVLVWRTPELDVVQNQDIKPTGQTNPNFGDRVALMEGFEGANYGPHRMVIEMDKVSPLYRNPNSPGEYYTTKPISRNLGYWTTGDEVAKGLKK